MYPLLLFNREGDCLAAKLRPGNVHSANGWEDMLLPEIERQQKQVLRLQNGDPTDGGLDFSSEPLVFRVSVASY